MNSTDLLDKLLELVQQSKGTSDFCSPVISWINQRKQDWDHNYYRVGVVGVTSCGKSQLINAILGMDILSSEIRPSTSQLVTCFYGDKPKAVIYLDDESFVELYGDDFTTDNLKQYTDESMNPDNDKHVNLIQLYSPWFGLDKNVALIDTPGLDADGYERHEKLTLECLIPTIDLCLYVTSIKENGNATDKLVLQTLAKRNCPVVMALNMRDSVYPSPDGKKTKYEVEEGYKKRAEDAIRDSGIVENAGASLVSVSALYANRWRSAVNRGTEPEVTKDDFIESNYQVLIDETKKLIKKQDTAIEWNRLKSLDQEIKNLIERINSIQGKKISVPDYFDFDQYVNDIQQFASSEYESITNAYKKFIQTKVDVEECLSAKDSATGIRSLMEEANKAVAKCTNAVDETNEKTEQLVSQLATKLNIPLRDVYKVQPLTTMACIRETKKEIETSIKTKEEGIRGGLKRCAGSIANFFGWKNDWGYENKRTTKMVMDTQKTKASILSCLKEAERFFSKYIDGWKRNQKDRCLIDFQNKIIETKSNYEKQRKAKIDQDELRNLSREISKQIATPLANNLLAIKKTKGTLRLSRSSNDNSGNYCELNAFGKLKFNLAKRIITNQHRSVFRAIAENLQLTEDYKPIIVGWDEESCGKFLYYSGLTDADKLLKPKPGECRRHEKTCWCLLYNTISIGSAAKEIKESGVGSVIKKGDKVILIDQSFPEELNSHVEVEAIRLLLSIKAGSEWDMMIYPLHQNPIYAYSFLRLQQDPDLKERPQVLINELQKQFTEYTNESIEKIIADIARSFV